MYEAFYGLTGQPFNITPDPKFLYLSESHREGLAHLLYGVERKQGIIVLTGESGSGKTTLLNALIQSVDKKAHVAYLVDSKISATDLYQFIARKFGLQVRDKGEFLVEFEDLLRHYAGLGEQCLVVIDEAQNLSEDVLEQVRLFTNFETHTEKLLQIVLSGTPLLQDKINADELGQLRQRTGVVYQLRPLDYVETKHYIEKRLSLCGVDVPLFTDAAIEALHAFSNGMPRRINVLCDLALFFGHAEQQPEIGPDLITEAAENMQMPEATKPVHRRWSNDAEAADALVAKQAWEVLTQQADDQRRRHSRRRLARLIIAALTVGLIGVLVFGGNIGQGNAADTVATMSQSIREWFAGVLSTPQDAGSPTKSAPESSE
jgi:general secretion pathway protein A